MASEQQQSFIYYCLMSLQEHYFFTIYNAPGTVHIIIANCSICFYYFSLRIKININLLSQT